MPLSTIFQLHRDMVVISWWLDLYLCNQCLSPLTLWVRTPLRRGELNTTLCDQICQWLVTCPWLSPVYSTNKTDRHDITEILLKVALNTIKQTKKQNCSNKIKQLAENFPIFFFVILKTFSRFSPMGIKTISKSKKGENCLIIWQNKRCRIVHHIIIKRITFQRWFINDNKLLWNYFHKIICDE